MKPVDVGIAPPEGWRGVVYAKDQPEYIPLPTLRAPDGRAASRWQPTPEEREAIASGADIFLTVHTFNLPLQPVLLTVGGLGLGESGEASLPADPPAPAPEVDPLAQLRPVVLSLRPGDTLWLTYPDGRGPLTRDAAERIHACLKKLIPEGVRVALGEEGLAPRAVLRPEAEAAAENG